MTTQHTPTPWKTVAMTKAHPQHKLHPYRIQGEDGFSPCLMYGDGVENRGTTKANAAFIVRACNAHEELVAALEHCVTALAEYDRNPGDDLRGFLLGALDNARSALAKARDTGG